MADPKYWIAGKRNAEVTPADIDKLKVIAKLEPAAFHADSTNTATRDTAIAAILDILIAAGLMDAA